MTIDDATEITTGGTWHDAGRLGKENTIQPWLCRTPRTGPARSTLEYLSEAGEGTEGQRGEAGGLNC